MSGEWGTLNGQRIISGKITIPYYGSWSADVTLNLEASVLPQVVALGVPTALPPPVTILLGDLTLQGYAYRVFSFAGARSARCSGGVGGWKNNVIAKSYQNPAGINLSMVLGDAAKEVGESVVVNPDSSIGTAYMREAAPAQRVLKQLAGALWWIDPKTGTTNVSPTRRSDAITTPFQVVSYNGGLGVFTIASENLGDWMPGRVFTSPTVTVQQTVSSVVHAIDNTGKVRTEVMTTP